VKDRRFAGAFLYCVREFRQKPAAGFHERGARNSCPDARRQFAEIFGNPAITNQGHPTGEPMSIDCYLKLDGITGEATQKDHKGEIELFHWDWNVHNDSCTVGSGSGVGKGTPGMLNCSKRYDSASPTLAKYSANGKHFSTATLTMAKSGEGQQTFLTVTLKEVFIAAVNVTAKQEGDVNETVAMSYGDIEFDYKPQKADGSMGGDIKFGWDIRSTETR